MSKFVEGPKWWGFFATRVFWPWYGVQNTSRGCIFIHHYSHENISRIHEIFFSWNFVIFSNFTHFTYIFLTKSCTKNDSNKDWSEICSNESILPKMIKVWPDYEKYFSESYPSYNLEEPIHLNKFLFNLCLSHFLYII